MGQMRDAHGAAKRHYISLFISINNQLGKLPRARSPYDDMHTSVCTELMRLARNDPTPLSYVVRAYVKQALAAGLPVDAMPEMVAMLTPTTVYMSTHEHEAERERGGEVRHVAEHHVVVNMPDAPAERPQQSPAPARGRTRRLRTTALAPTTAASSCCADGTCGATPPQSQLQTPKRSEFTIDGVPMCGAAPYDSEPDAVPTARRPLP